MYANVQIETDNTVIINDRPAAAGGARTGLQPQPRRDGTDAGAEQVFVTANFKTIASLAGSALLVGLVVALSFWAFSQIEATTAARKHVYALISGANALMSDIKDAETGQRGFSLTGEEVFLEPYLAVRRTVSDDLDALRNLTLVPAARLHLDALVPLVRDKLADMSNVIELRRQRQMSSVLAAAGASSQGRQLMDAIRAEIGGYIAIEEAVLAGYDSKLQSNMRQLFVLIVTASLLTFLLALSFAWLVYRDTQHRLRQLLHVETQQLLERQEILNKNLAQANRTLHISEGRLAVTLNSIGDAVMATDAEGRVTLMNPLAERLTGWPRDEAAGRPIDEIFHIISQQTRLPSTIPVRDTLTHGTVQGLANYTIMIARDGSECDIADSCAPIRDPAGAVVGAVLVFRDVTERQRIDRALLEKNTELEEARAVADKANLAKSEFLSNMSHELRTPLSAILGFAQLMESAAPPPSAVQKRSIDQILKAGWYLLDLINEILDLALIESGRMSLSMEPMALADLMQECEVMIEPQAKKRGISLHFPQFEDHCYVKADRTRVKQILANLLSNAIKYNSPGGTVVVDYTVNEARRIRVSISDAGAGLTPEQITQLFQPFNRLGQEANTEEGTGIGLVMSKRLVELMGGAIGVASTPGRGSVFWFELNAAAEPSTVVDAAMLSAMALPATPGAANSRTLLYVEDNPANLMLVEDLIARRPDIRMLSAQDGLTGIEIAHASRPGVILMDINLPGISGIEALHILLADPATAHIPVVALSANAMPRDIERGLAAGFFRYLTKPIKVGEFMLAIDAAFTHAETGAGSATTEKTCQ
jgi:PAS domain S-box-containing protein